MGVCCSKRTDAHQAEEVEFYSVPDAEPRQHSLAPGSAAPPPRRAPSVRRQARALKKAKDPELQWILNRIQPNVVEFFGKLNEFNKNKAGIEALRLKLMPDAELDAVEVEVVGLYKDDAETQIRLEFYQRQLDGIA